MSRDPIADTSSTSERRDGSANAMHQGRQRLDALGSRYWSAFAMLALGYAIAAYIGLSWAQVEGAGSPVWPAAGIGIAGLMLGGLRLWPAIVVGRLMAAVASGSEQPLWADFAIASGNALSALVAVCVFRRFPVDLALGSIASLGRFILVAAGLASLCMAVIGTGTLWLSSELSASMAMHVFVFWAVGLFAGTLTTGPVILSWYAKGIPSRAGYLVLLLLAIVALALLIAVNENSHYLRAWHVLPLLIWAALAFQIRGASIAVLLLSIIAIWGTGAGYVAFTDEALPLPQRVHVLQQFISIVAVTILLLAAVDEERRTRSADRLRLALDAAGQGIVEVDLERASVQLDQQAAHLLTGQTISLSLSPEHFLSYVGELYRDELRNCLESGSRGTHRKAIDHEFTTVNSGSSKRWLAFHARFDGVSVATGFAPMRLRGMLRDITQRKHAEARIIESERFTRNVLDNLFAIVCVMKPDGKLIEVNRVPLEAAGLEAKDVLGRMLWDCFWWAYSPDTQRRLEQSIAHAAQGNVIRYDVQLRVRGGALIWTDFQISPMRDEAGSITHLIASGTDVSKRKHAEAERQRLTSIIDETPDFIGVAMPGGDSVYINPGGREMIGLSNDADLKRLSISDWHSPEALAVLQNEALPQAFRDGVWRGETELLRRDGRSIPVSQIILAHKSDAGVVEFVSTIMRDVTDQKRAFEHQNILLRELSHRVKNTLAVIQSIARRTLRRYPDSREFAAVFHGRLSSLAASHSLLIDAEWRGASLVDVIHSQLEPLIAAKLECLSLDGPHVMLPPETATQMGLVLHELGTNAVKHGTFATEQGALHVSWTWTANLLRISWKETGGRVSASTAELKGFGSTLIDRMSCGEVERDFDPDGLTITFSIVLPMQEWTGGEW